MLKFEFLKHLHVENNKIKLSSYLIKDLKWFGGKKYVHLHEVFGSNLDECVH
jgi:hypothetical protein